MELILERVSTGPIDESQPAPRGFVPAQFAPAPASFRDIDVTPPTLLSLAKQEWPDTAAYADPEVVWRLDKRHHAGLVVASEAPDRVQLLLDQYVQRFQQDFYATQPPLEKPLT